MGKEFNHNRDTAHLDTPSCRNAERRVEVGKNKVAKAATILKVEQAKVELVAIKTLKQRKLDTRYASASQVAVDA